MNLPALTQSITRRNFLQLSGFGLLSLMMPRLDRLFPPDQEILGLGRVIDPLFSLHSKPVANSPITRYVWRDILLPIQEITINEDEQAYNRVWYRVSEGAYAYSGGIQPVEIRPGVPLDQLSPPGQLVELTVPFTDARRRPGEGEIFVYRLYFGTTHWAVGVERDASGAAWYELYDDRFKRSYYALARHFTPVATGSLEPLSPGVPPGEKRIEVHLDKQIVVAFEHNRPVYMSRAATGGNWATGNYETSPGAYFIRYKSPSSHMAAGDRAAPNSYDLPGVPWVSYFTEDGISFHGTYWHNDFGKPRSHGCVNLPTQAARWIYLWTNPVVSPEEKLLFSEGDPGTRIDVF